MSTCYPNNFETLTGRSVIHTFFSGSIAKNCNRKSLVYERAFLRSHGGELRIVGRIPVRWLTVTDRRIMSSTDLLASLESHEDVVAWINDALDPDQLGEGAPMELTELDHRVSNLVGALEIASEDTSANVERLIDDISRSATRLTYDLHFMRDGALSLQAILQNVESKSQASVAAETNAALERLHFLDTVKRNMEAAREVLREAESWGTLESDVTSLLGEKNYEKAAERLSEANNSMAVFENTPEYESRRALMVSLQNQLEAALSSALVFLTVER